ncbi:DnaJ and TPR domain protein [Sarocladium strictum]
MHLNFSTLALAAGLLATASISTAQDVPADLPVSELLSTAQTHLARGETSEALTFYDAAIARDPSNYLTFFKRATTYLSLGRTNQATDDFNKVLSLKPGFEGAHVQLAKIKAKTGDWDSARAEYVAANKAVDSVEISELEEAKGAAKLAEEAANASQWEECVNQAGVAIVIASRAPKLRELRGRCRFERGELEEGMADMQHLLQMKPGDTTPHVVISATAFYGLGDMALGLGQIKKCLHSDPDSKVCKKLHKQEKVIQKALAKAEGQLEKGQTTSAGRTLMGTGDDPGLVSSIREQSETLREAGSIPSQAAFGLYNKVIDMTCQAYIESNHRDADKYCTESLQNNPDSFWGLLHKGKSQLRAENYEASINTLEQAKEADPSKRGKVDPILRKAQIALKRSKTKDYYKVIGVAPDADEKQIKSAYRKASKQYHPDKAAKQGISKEDAEKKMASINEAYEVLSDPELRARFDRGDDPNSHEGQQGGGGHPFHGSPFGGFGGGGNPFMFQQGGGGPGGGFKFNFG